MSGFGKWYEEQQAAENGEATASSSWFGGSDEVLPLFNTENMPTFSLESMRESMEAQMPRKILGMGYQQRFQVFCALLVLSVVFFALAFFVGLPTIALKPQKFAISFTCGSMTFMGSFGILKGPVEHLKSMFSSERMFFTTIYFGSMYSTLYLCFNKGGIRGYVLVLSASAVQLLALLWYLISFLPGGTAGLKVVTRAICTMLQPVFKVCFRLQSMCVSTCVSYCTRG